MEDKSLADKAVDIKGKRYVLVQDRVLYFNDKYPEGSITTELVSAPESKYIIIKARVSPDKGPRIFTGYSQAVVGEGMVNKTSALENAETSAVGRALAFMGIGVIESIASADEIVKATAPRAESKELIAQKERIMFLLKQLGAPNTTKAQVEASVLARTKLKLEETNYDAIANALAAQLEATDPTK